MSKTAVMECRIFFTNGKFAEKDGVRVHSVLQTCGKFVAECYVTLTARGPRGHFTDCRLYRLC